jgi:hypothetical protein
MKKKLTYNEYDFKKIEYEVINLLLNKKENTTNIYKVDFDSTKFNLLDANIIDDIHVLVAEINNELQNNDLQNNTWRMKKENIRKTKILNTLKNEYACL